MEWERDGRASNDGDLRDARIKFTMNGEEIKGK